MTLFAAVSLIALLIAVIVAFWQGKRAEHWRSAANASGLRAAQLEVAVAKDREAAAERLELLQSTQKQLEQSFRALASEALQTNSQMFLDRSREQIDGLVAPVRETLLRFDENVKQLELSRTGAYAGLREQIQNMLQSQTQLRDAADQLKNALRSPSQRGRWGEIQLRRVVELAGMLPHCDFNEQPTLFGDKLQRPDLIIHLPNNREIVIDSKVSLDAYLRSLDCKEEQEQDRLLNDHARQVRTHVKTLGEKNYWDRLPGSPDFVVAFLPLESIYSAALQKDPELLNFGVDRRVLLATPTTLVALLYAVAHGWREREFTENAERIRELGKELYERVVSMQSHVVTLGRSLGKAVDSYNSAVGSLENRVLVSARKFRDLKGSSAAEMEVLEPLDATPRELTAGDWEAQPRPRAS